MEAISRETCQDGDTSLRCIYLDIEAISRETSLNGDTSLRCIYHDIEAISRITSLDGDALLRCIYHGIEAISRETSLDGGTSLRCIYHDIEAISREPVWMATHHCDAFTTILKPFQDKTSLDCDISCDVLPTYWDHIRETICTLSTSFYHGI